MKIKKITASCTLDTKEPVLGEFDDILTPEAELELVPECNCKQAAITKILEAVKLLADPSCCEDEVVKESIANLSVVALDLQS